MRFTTSVYLLATSLALSQALPSQLTAGTDHWCGNWAGKPNAVDVPSTGQLPRQESPKLLFIEPQLQNVPFQPIISSEPKVQIPKIWGNNKFRLALLSYASTAPVKRVYATSKSRWIDFYKGLDLLMNECVAQGTGGAYLIPPSPGLTQSTLALYAYEVGSRFDFEMNYYMTSPYGIDPSKIGLGTTLEAARVPVDEA